jgi:3-hydroxyacyl-CoA dehydrogenase / enoyl-CoA hydratase / 3-hydroxybutyryl-CoA epimerase
MTAAPSARGAETPARLAHATSPDGVACVTLQGGVDGVAVVDLPMLRELGRTLDALDADAAVRGVVLRADAPRGVGAAPDTCRHTRIAGDAARDAAELAELMARVGRGKPVVACIERPWVGAGFSLALACRGRVCSTHVDAVMGFSEVDRALIPAGGGLGRLVDALGPRAALFAALDGRSFDAEAARSAGLVDRASAPLLTFDAAAELARQPRLCAARSPTPAARASSFVFRGRIASALLEREARAHGAEARPHTARAARAATQVVLAHARRGAEAALAAESRLLGELMVSEAAQHIERATDATAKVETRARTLSASAASPSRLAVIGAGTIGTGVALAALRAGITVRARDVDERALARLHRAAWSTTRGGSIGALTTTLDATGLRNAQLLIEAAPEVVEIKRAILAEVEAAVSPSCVIASSTAAIPIRDLASACADPSRVLGMHFFAPVAEHPLVEIVRPAGLAPAALGRAVALGRSLGKTVVVVSDSPGFFAMRVLAPMLAEAVRLVGEGVPIETVDAALETWGFSHGPLRILDEVGIDVLDGAFGLFSRQLGDRWSAPDELETLLADHRLGRRNGRGFYLHAARAGVDDTVYAALRRAEPAYTPTREEVQMRCVLPMVQEALRCLEEGVVARAEDADVSAVLALGFPNFRGGPLTYVHSLGATELLRRCRWLEQTRGLRFAPAPLLVELERSARRLYD